MLTERDRRLYKWIEDYKAITVNQATELFYEGQYESCRRRLKQLEDRGELKSYKSKLLNQKVYYQDRKVSDHDLLVLDFAREITKLGGTIRRFRTQPQYAKRLIRPDAYLEFEYKKDVYFTLIEVDYTHYTNHKKISMYEYLYHQQELQKECYGTFPILIIARPQIDIKYKSNNFEIIHTDYRFKNLARLLLCPITV